MSDHKAVYGDTALKDEACLIEALENMFGSVERNTTLKHSKWSFENIHVDICIRSEQLPEYVRGIGDVGFIRDKTGKFSFTGCSAEDSHYFDQDKQRKLRAEGMTPEEAEKAYPIGTYANVLNGYVKNVENQYAGVVLKKAIQAKCPGAIISKPTGVVGNHNAIQMRGSCTASDLARLGIKLPF